MNRILTGRALISIASLFLASCALFTSVILWSAEKRADNWNEGMDRLAIVAGQVTAGGQEAVTVSKLPLRLEEVLEGMEGVKSATFARLEELPVSRGETQTVQKILFVSNDFFEVMSFKEEFEIGETGLRPGDVILSSALAEQLSVTTGDVIDIGFESGARAVSSNFIHRGFPAESHIQFDAMVLFEEALFEESTPYLNTFASFDTSIYVLLSDSANVPVLERKTDAVMKQRLESEFGPEFASQLDFAKTEMVKFPELRQSSDRLRLNYSRPSSPGLFKATLLAAAAIFFAGCINFLTIMVLNANAKTHSSAIARCLGANKVYFLTEVAKVVVPIMVIAVLTAIPVAYWLSSTMLGVENPFSHLTQSPRLMLFILAVLLVSLLTFVSLPSSVSAIVKPNEAITGKVNSSGWGSMTRYILLGAQFTAAFTLIGFATSQFSKLSSQMKSDRGFEAAGLGIIENADTLGREIMGLDSSLKAVGANNVTFGANAPGEVVQSTAGIHLNEKQEPIIAMREEIGYDFFETIGGTVISGVDLSEDPKMRTSSMPVLLNRQLAEILLDDGVEIGSLLGQIVLLEGVRRESVEAEVIGIVEAPRFASDYTLSGPAFYYYRPPSFRTVFFRTQNSDGIADIKTWIEESYPDGPLRVRPVSQVLSSYYAADRLALVRLLFLSMLAVFLAVVSAYGTTQQLAVQSRQELTMRRIIGASMKDIVTFLMRPIMYVVVVSLFVGILLLTLLSQSETISLSTMLGAIASGALILIISILMAVGPIFFKLANADPAKVSVG